jgi:hypothetical protein
MQAPAQRVVDDHSNVIATQEHATGASCRFEFQKRSQLFIRTHNERFRCRDARQQVRFIRVQAGKNALLD